MTRAPRPSRAATTARRDATWRARRERTINLPAAVEAFGELAPYVWPGELPAIRVERRRAEIEALPAVEHAGERLRSVRCVACGRTWNYRASALWALVDLSRVRCPVCATRG